MCRTVSEAIYQRLCDLTTAEINDEVDTNPNWAAEALKNWREGEKKKANDLVGRVVFVDEVHEYKDSRPLIAAENTLPTKCHLDDIKRDESEAALAAEDEEMRDESATHTLTEEDIPHHDHNSSCDCNVAIAIREVTSQHWIIPRLWRYTLNEVRPPGKIVALVPKGLLDRQEALQRQVKEHQDEVRLWLQDAYPLGFAEGVDGPPSSGVTRPARYR